MNGFTQSIKIDNDYMLVSAQNSYVQSLDNFFRTFIKDNR